MSYNFPSKNLNARLIDVVNGRRVWAYACGKDTCDHARFNARLIDVVNGVRVWAVASECRELPLDKTIQWAAKDILPPFGVTTYLRFRLNLGHFAKIGLCFGSVCPEIDLEWTGSDFQGSFAVDAGLLNVRFYYTHTRDPLTGFYEWFVDFSGCLTTPRTLRANLNCVFPAKFGGQGLQIGTDCCPSALSTIPDAAFTIESYHERRRMGRFIDVVNGVRVFQIDQCCGTFECDIADCCECDASPYQYRVNVAGVTNGPGPPFPGTACGCHNGDWLLTFSNFNLATNACTWASPPGPCLGAPASGMWTLTCDTTSRKYRLGTQHTPGGGGSASYELPFDDWDCLGPNVMTLSSSPPPAGSCSSWPSTLTVTPV